MLTLTVLALPTLPAYSPDPTHLSAISLACAASRGSPQSTHLRSLVSAAGCSVRAYLGEGAFAHEQMWIIQMLRLGIISDVDKGSGLKEIRQRRREDGEGRVTT